MRYLRPGDVFYVWRLDRLGRTMKGIIERVNTLNERGVEFVSLQENIDTTSPAGKFIFHVFAALAELERDLIRQRMQAGLSAVRARGRAQVLAHAHPGAANSGADEGPDQLGPGDCRHLPDFALDALSVRQP